MKLKRNLSLLVFFLFSVLTTSHAFSKQSESEDPVSESPFLIEGVMIYENGGRKLFRPQTDNLPISGAIESKSVEIPGRSVQSTAPIDQGAQTNASTGSQSTSGSLFQSVGFSIPGGALTAYQYSGQGLELDKVSPGSNAVVLIQSHEVDISALGSDDSLNAQFERRAYGLDSYRDMQNLFSDKKPGADYSLTGFGFSYDIGKYSMHLLNAVREPEQKKKVFNGLDTDGPYRLGNPRLMPGSVEVTINGAKLKTGSDYTVDYQRGELIFNRIISRSERIVAKYELTTSSNGSPGKTFGMHFGTSDIKEEQVSKEEKEDRESGQEKMRPWSAVSLSDWGATYLEEQKIMYHEEDGVLNSPVALHTVWGLNGSFLVGGHSQVDVEVASSQGNKGQETGRYASATFQAKDSSASDGDPKGPYYLDEYMLPVVEDSVEMWLNDHLLEQDEDYRIDVLYGRIMLTNENLILDEDDVIRMEYRYITDDIYEQNNDSASSGTAATVSMSNHFGQIEHTLSMESRDPGFYSLGANPGQGLTNMNQTVHWRPTSSASFSYESSRAETLLDAASTATRSETSAKYGLDYGMDDFFFHWDMLRENTNNKNDTAASGNDNAARNMSLTWSPSSMVRLEWRNSTQGRSQSEGRRSNNVQDDYRLTYNPNRKFNANFSHGKESESQDANQVNSRNTVIKQDMDLSYRPNSNYSMDYKVAKISKARAQTQAEIQQTSRINEEFRFRARPNQKTTINIRKKQKQDNEITGTETDASFRYDIMFLPSSSTRILLFASTEKRNKQSVSDRNISFKAFTLSKPLCVGHHKIEMTLKRDERSIYYASFSENSTVTNNNKSRALAFSAKTHMFSEENSLAYEFSSRNGFTITNDSYTPDKDIRHSLNMDIPFIGESKLAFSMDDSRRSGSRETQQRDYRVTLTGQMTDLFDLQLSWTRSRYSDMTSPEASTTDGELNVAVKGAREW